MSTRAFAKKLGGKRVIGRELKSETDLINVVRDGLPAQTIDHVFADFAVLQVPIAVVYRVIGNSRTLQRKRAQSLKLSAIESDRLMRLVRILVRAEAALGDGARGRRWLVQPNRALGGVRPIDLLDSDTGAQAVERTLGRIEHGIYG